MIVLLIGHFDLITILNFNVGGRILEAFSVHSRSQTNIQQNVRKIIHVNHKRMNIGFQDTSLFTQEVFELLNAYVKLYIFNCFKCITKIH